MIVSHFDSDHAGGYRITFTITLDGYALAKDLKPPALPNRQSTFNDQACVIGEFWHWQGVEFEVLWPP